jgi:thiamine phosphate synthase YjbQ (UPF0047 family)
MHITASVFVDDESGLDHDYEVWLEELARHAPTGQACPGAGCTTVTARHVPRESREQCRRAAMVAVSNGRLDFGTLDRVFSGQAEWLARES